MGSVSTQTAQSVYFTGPRSVEVRTEEVPTLSADGLLVRSIKSAISAGTELLLYRGQAPTDLQADTSIATLAGSLDFPLKYGYSTVGRVVETGSGVDPAWRGRRVFAFHPHQSLFVARPEDVIALPEDLATESALFLPNMETAVSLVQDGRPILGERVAVFGQGVVGLLLAGLLARFPLTDLVAVEPTDERRQFSRQMGVPSTVSPDEMSQTEHEFDLCYELSGRPETLNQVLSATGYGGRVVIGSWYGNKSAPLELGGRFHRSRITLLSSQVSTIDPMLRGRWTKERRFQTCLDLLSSVRPERLITHRFPITEAAEAYRLLDEGESDAVQVILSYED